MTGTFMTIRHLLTHEAGDLTTAQMPCWTSEEAGARQIKKQKCQDKFKKQQDLHPKRTVLRHGGQGTGDNMKVSDYFQRAGVHGAKELYTHTHVST